MILNNYLYCKSDSPQLLRTVFFIKKTTTLQKVTGENTPNLALNRVLEHFLKCPPLKKY